MPRDLDQKPTTESIRELHEWNETHWSGQRALDTQLRDLILESHAVPVSDLGSEKRVNRLEPERVTVGEGPRTIDVIASLYSTPPSIGVMSRVGGAGKSRREADKIELALNELMDQLNPPTDSPRRRQRKQMIALGREAGLYLPGHVYWWDTPRKGVDESDVQWLDRYRDWRRKAPIPILWRDLPAASTFPPSLGAVNDLALSTSRTTWHELRDIFSEEEMAQAIASEDAKPHEEVTLAIFANRAWVSYSVLAGAKTGILGRHGFPDHILRSIEHGMDMCPIRILPGRTSAWKEPGLWWLSALFAIRDMIPQLDRRLSEASTASRMSIMPWLKWTRNRNAAETEEEGKARIRKMMTADLVVVDAGDPQAGIPAEDLSAIYIPPFGKENIDLAGFQQNTIRELAGTPEILTGMGQATSSGTAWEANFTAEMAKSFHRETTEAVIAAEIDHAETLIRCIESFGEPIELVRHDEEGGTLVIDPKEISKWEPILKGTYNLQVPVNKIAMIQTAVSIMTASHQADLPLDDFWIMENMLDIPQPYEHFKQALVTKFLQSPEMARWRSKLLLEEAEVELQGDEFVSGQEFEEGFAGRIPPEMAAFARNRIAQGAGRAGAPGSAQPGGPRPQLVAP